MPRERFRRHLHELQGELLVMGSMVEKALERAMEALKNRDLKLARQVIADDVKINQKRFDIEEKCLELIVTQQPMASDLRIIIAVLNIIVDVERIADHAGGNARIAVMIGNEPPLKPLVDLPRMSQKTGDMLRRSLDAFINHDAEAARRICDEDDEVDNLCDQVFRELLTFMVEDLKAITRATRLIWVAHNLERSADRVTNICERVIYVVTGEMEETSTRSIEMGTVLLVCVGNASRSQMAGAALPPEIVPLTELESHWLNGKADCQRPHH